MIAEKMPPKEKIAQSIVVSTRIRLARNIAEYPFPEKLTKSQGEEIIRAVQYELMRLEKFKRYDISEMSVADATLLQEKHLISPALIKNKRCGAAFVSSDKTISVMVNEEDHLREQYILKGLNLNKAYERVVGIDESIGSSLHFAYDEKLGFLTACPSNLGTGMRASVMMFLPALTRYNQIEQLLPTLKAGGMTVRGVFGEGSAAEGFIYQVSNERTLGFSEAEILGLMQEVALHLCELELRYRAKMLEEEGLALKDKCLRAYGLLTNCALLSAEEFACEMAKVKLGLALGFFETEDEWGVNDFVANMRPATFRLENCSLQATDGEVEEMRASVVRQVLPELVLKADRGRE